MSDAKDRLKKLLDGDLEASDIAEDASLVSLADRLYGIKIANVKPVKARDFDEKSNSPLPDGEQQFGQTSNLMVEVIGPSALPVPELPHLEMPELPNAKRRFSLRSIISVPGLVFVTLNVLVFYSPYLPSSDVIADVGSTISHCVV